MRNYFLLLLTIAILSGCGYKPTSHYAKDVIVGNVYVDVAIDINNAQNSVLIKDSMNEMILNQFNARLTSDKTKADSFILVKLSSVSHTALASDNYGYVKTYRTTVNIEVRYNKKSEAIKILSVSNYYDYVVDTDSTITDQKKEEAVKIASTKALSDIFSKIAISSLKE